MFIFFLSLFNSNIALEKKAGVYHDKEDLLWEMPDLDLASQGFQPQSAQPASLLAIYSMIHAAIKNQCHLTFEYLSNFSNVYDLVAEYTTRVIPNME